MSHVHWDHIMGFPFFVPAYIPGNHIAIYGCHDVLEEAFRRQQARAVLPGGLRAAGRADRVRAARARPRYEIAGLAVTRKLQRHAATPTATASSSDGKVVVYSTDSEHKLETRTRPQAFVEFFRDADLVIFDAMYSLADAISVKADWGHSSNIVGVELCQMARAKHLCLFHHEPVFDDEQIAAVLQETRRLEEITRGDHRVRDLGRLRRPGDRALRSRPEHRRRADARHAAERLALGGAARGPRAPAAGAAAWSARCCSAALLSLLAAGAARAAPAARWPGSTPTRCLHAASARIRARWSSSRSTRRASRSYGQWPWPRTLLARLVDADRRRRGPPPSGSTSLCPSPTASRRAALAASSSPASTPELAARLDALPSNDAVLAAALRGRPVVLGVAGLESRAPEPATRRPARAGAHRVGGDPAPFVRASRATLRQRATRSTRRPRGHGLMSADPERGVVRRMPLLAAVGGALVPALGIEMLRVGGGEPARLGARTGARGVEAVGVGDLVIPTEPDGSVWVHFTRARSRALRLGGRRARGHRSIRGSSSGKLVLVGVTALGLVSTTRPRRVASACPGVEIHAQLLENIFDGDAALAPAAGPRGSRRRCSPSAGCS